MLASSLEIPVWVAALAGVLAIVALIDRLLMPTARWYLRRRLSRTVESLNQSLRLRIQPFKLARRRNLIEQLLHDPEVMSAIEAHATAKGVTAKADDAWCWSQWSGYLREPDGAFVAQWFTNGGARAEHIHTSGHASAADLRTFAAAIAPKQMAPMHGANWDREQPGFPPILRLRDGETHAL